MTDNPVSDPHDPGPPADRAGPVWLVLSLVGVVVVVVALVAQVAGGSGTESVAPAAASSSLSTGESTRTGGPDTTGADADATTAGTTIASTTAREQITPPAAWGSVDLPETPPSQVVEQFLDAVLAADCARADQTLTAGFKQREGNCRTSGLVPDDVEEYAAEVDEPKPEKSEPIVVVPATLTFAGQDFRYQFELMIADGAWRIDGVEQ